MFLIFYNSYCDWIIPICSAIWLFSRNNRLLMVFRYYLILNFSYSYKFSPYCRFQRKLCYFSTFLHFFGCTFCAFIQRYISSDTPAPSGNIVVSSSGSSSASNNSSSKFSHFFGQTTTPIKYLIFLSVTKVLTQALTNLSMMGLNYPAKVIFKSALPIFTMLLGTVSIYIPYSIY